MARQFIGNTFAGWVATLWLVLSPVSARADQSWLAQCAKEVSRGENDGSEPQCYAEHQARLTAAQKGLLDRLYAGLAAKTGPEGSDHAAAAKSFDEAQRHWLAHVQADCRVVAFVFGRGTALGLAGASCQIQHYETRNAALKEFAKTWLDLD